VGFKLFAKKECEMKEESLDKEKKALDEISNSSESSESTLESSSSSSSSNSSSSS